MEIKRLDHFVLTTKDLQQCLHFYRDVLQLEVEEKGGRYALHFGRQKINIHTRKAEFLPAAAFPTYGSLDFCLIVEGPIQRVYEEILATGYPVEQGPCIRHGAEGTMDSIYLRDPDGNLVQLSSYGAESCKEKRQ